MKLIDTHNHLYLEDFDPEQEVLVNAARESGIDTLLLPNVDVETIGRMHDLCDRFPDFQCVPGIPHTRFKLYRQQAGRNAEPFCRSEKLYTRIYR